MAPLSPLPCVTDGKSVRLNNNLSVTFHRSAPVPDNNKIYPSPALRGQYSLTPVSKYQNAFQAGATGVFLPMKQRETLGIHFAPSGYIHYLVRVYAGKVNVLSCKSATNADQTSEMREQDYIFVKNSTTLLSGFSETRHIGRQFVVMPYGSRHVIELDNSAKALRFEVTPLKLESSRDQLIRIHTPKDKNIYIPGNYTTRLLANSKLKRFFGFPDASLREFKVMLRDAEIEDGMTVNQVGWKPNHLLPIRLEYKPNDVSPTAQTETELKARGLRHPWFMFYMGSPHKDIPDLDASEQRPPHTIPLGAGGRIEQTILHDPYPPLWNAARTTVFEVHVVSHEKYRSITGQSAPAPLDPRQKSKSAKQVEFQGCEIRNLGGPLTDFYCVRDDEKKKVGSA